MPRTLVSRSLVARSIVNRLAASAFRVPYALWDLGVSHLWDFRTGYTGANSRNVKDLKDGVDMRYAGGSALSAVYTAGFYRADLERGNADYFVSRNVVLTNGATAMTYFGFIKIETAGSVNRNILTQWEPSTNQRGFLFRVDNTDVISLVLSSNGTLQAVYSTSATLTDTAAMHSIIATYDTTNRAIIYVDGVAWSTSLISGSHPASIFSPDIPLMIGASTPSAPAGYWDGYVGLNGIIKDRALTATEVSNLHKILNNLGTYI